MANITCPQCSRFVDDSAKFCPGCKYNIKKYVKEMKKKGGTVSGSISFGSVYSKTSAGTDVVPELEFLKPAAPEPAPAPEPAAPVYEEPVQAYEPAAPAYEEAYPVSDPPVVPTYEEPAPAATESRGVSTVDPRTLFPKDTIPTFRPAYKPRVLASAPAYDPNYKKTTEAAAAAPAYEEPAAPAYEEPAAPAAPAAPVPVPVPAAPAAPAAAVPPEALLYQQPVPAAPAAPAYQPAAPAAPAYQPAAPVPAYQAASSSGIPASAAAAAAVPPEALLYQQPAPAATAAPYQAPAAAYQAPAAAYQAPSAAAYQAPSSYSRSGGFTAARPVQNAAPYQQQYAQRQQPTPAATGVFESAALNCGIGGGGALSGEISGPTILEKLRAEEEERKANASIFESPNLRAAEKELKNGTRQPAGGLHGEISFDNYIAPERGSFGQATAYQIQQAAYVAAGANGGGQSSVPPYAVQPGAGPGGMAYQLAPTPATPPYAQQASQPAYAATPGQAASVPAFAAGPGMGNPYAPVNGAIPYITQTPAASANPMLGGGGNPILGAGSANPLLGGGA